MQAAKTPATTGRTPSGVRSSGAGGLNGLGRVNAGRAHAVHPLMRRSAVVQAHPERLAEAIAARSAVDAIRRAGVLAGGVVALTRLQLLLTQLSILD